MSKCCCTKQETQRVEIEVVSPARAGGRCENLRVEYSCRGHILPLVVIGLIDLPKSGPQPLSVPPSLPGLCSSLSFPKLHSLDSSSSKRRNFGPKLSTIRDHRRRVCVTYYVCPAVRNFFQEDCWKLWHRKRTAAFGSKELGGTDVVARDVSTYPTHIIGKVNSVQKACIL